MGPKVDAAIAFARSTGNEAVIGALGALAGLVTDQGGTRVSTAAAGLTYR
jgi:carbamate kinase